MKNNSLVTAIVVGIVGVLLIVFENRADLLSWLVILIGITFIIPGVYMLLAQLMGKPSGRSGSAIISAVGGICLGAVLCIIPDAFVSIIIYILAFSLIVGGVVQIATLSRYRMPAPLYIIPVLVTATGVVMIFLGARKDASVIVLVSGIAMVLYSINYLVEYSRIRKSLTPANPR